MSDTTVICLHYLSRNNTNNSGKECSFELQTTLTCLFPLFCCTSKYFVIKCLKKKFINCKIYGVLLLFYDLLKLLHIFYHLEKIIVFAVMVETWENPEFILSNMAKAKLQKLPVFLRRCHLKTKNVNKRVKTETLDTIIPQSSCCSVRWISWKQLLLFEKLFPKHFEVLVNPRKIIWTLFHCALPLTCL